MKRLKAILYIVCFLVMLSLSIPQEVLAQGAASAQPGALEKIFMMLPMFVIVFFIFYLLVHLPANKEAKIHSDLLNSLKKGEQVVTSSGMIGRVAGIEKDYILLEVANNVKVKVESSHVKSRRE